jgi:hypothetical protein
MNQVEHTNLIVRGAAPIADLEVHNYIKNLNFDNLLMPNNSYRMNTHTIQEYLEYIPQWIKSSNLNTIDGLDKFKHKYIISGITQAFDDFYIRHINKNIVILRGEYPYLKRFVKNIRLYEGKFYDNDAFIISAPFSASGRIHEEFYSVMENAEKHSIPTLIDCAFFGICSGLSLTLNYQCVDSVCFSLSKAFASGCFRSGIQFTNVNLSSISVQNNWNYVQLLSAKIGLLLSQNYSPDYIFNKYRNIQEDICKRHGLEPSDTVIFGLSSKKTYDSFEIDGYINRCCITPLIKQISRH